jgi:hypothetical protein
MDGVYYTHEAVIHDPNFVNPDFHTQNIENMWMRVKRKLRRQFGTSRALFRISMEELQSTGMMTSSMHFCIASLTYMLYNFI